MLCLFNKLLYLVNGAKLHFHRWFLAGFVNALLEHIPDMFWLDIHVEYAFILVDNDFGSITLNDHLFKLVV